MRNVADKICREYQNKLFVFNNFFFRESCQLMDNVVKYGRTWQVTDDNIIRHAHITCCIPEATDTLSEYVVLIVSLLQH